MIFILLYILCFIDSIIQFINIYLHSALNQSIYYVEALNI